MNCPRCGTPMSGGVCPECGFPVTGIKVMYSPDIPVMRALLLTYNVSTHSD